MRGEAKHCYILCIVILEEQLQIQFQKGFVCGEPIPDNTEVELLAWVVSCPVPCLLPLANGLELLVSGLPTNLVCTSLVMVHRVLMG